VYKTIVHQLRQVLPSTFSATAGH